MGDTENVLGGSLILQLPSESPPFDFTFLFSPSAAHDGLKAHKDVLSSKCNFFMAMFASEMADAHVEHMTIDDFSKRTMSHFLHYLYHGTLHESFCSECFVELFKAGGFFGCMALCSLMLESVNDLGTLCVAVGSLSLLAWPKANIPARFRSFVAQNLGSFTSQELTGLPKGALCALISVASHGMCLAVSIFQFLEAWAQANGLQTLPWSLIKLVPFERMWETEFEKYVEPSPFISEKAMPFVKSKVPLGRDWSLLTGEQAFIFNHSFFGCSGIAVAPKPPLTSFVVYVTDGNAGTVHMFDGTTGQPMDGLSVMSFGSKGHAPGQFISPTEIALSISSSSGMHEDGGSGTLDVFVCDFQRVQVFSAMGVHKRSFGSEQCFRPEGLSIDQVNHEVHVCDFFNHCISVFAACDGRYLFSYGSEGAGPGQLYEPTGVAVDGERGLVAVVDHFNPRVSVFKTSGEFVRCFGHGEKDSDPMCQFGNRNYKYVALDPQSGHIVVSDNFTKRVQVMTWDGEWVGGFGPGLPERGPELKEVRSVAVGPQGQLFLICRDMDGNTNVFCF